MADIAGALAAIEAKFRAEWTLTPISMDNDDSGPTTEDADGVSEPFVYFDANSEDSDIIGVGAPGNQTTVDYGVIEATVFVPLGSQRAIARQHATAIGEIFRVKEFYQSAGACVRTWQPRVRRGETTSSENPNGKWWAVAVSIPFEFIRYV